MNKIHPWQSGPSELIRHAIEHLDQEDDFNQRIAFLLLDVGTETLFKTFLQLPEEVTGTKVSFSERTKASEGNFHELIQGIRKAAGHRLNNIDLTHIQFYHDLRNKLYHQGNGITVPTDKAKGYASLVVECLKALLDVDLNPILFSKQEKEQQQANERAKFREFEEIRKEIKSQLEELHQETILALERVDPALVLPSFGKQFEKWAELFKTQFYAWSSKSSVEDEIDNVDFEGKHRPHQYAALLAEAKPTMPRALRNFVDKYHLKGDDLIAIVFPDDFEEVLLNIAVIALNLRTETNNIYFRTQLILGQNAVALVEQLLGKEVDDPISELIKLSKEVSKEIQEIKYALLTSN